MNQSQIKPTGDNEPQTAPDRSGQPADCDASASAVAGSRPLKIALVNHSDTLGGASVVTFRLMNALRKAGVDARMVVLTKTSDSPHVYEVSPRFTRRLKFIGECVSSAIANGFNRSNLFTISPASSGCDISGHHWIEEADIIVLNWVNQGMLSLNGLNKLLSLGKPVVWTMHDMWPLTGVCHHSHDCDGYRRRCGNCPLLYNGRFHDDASAKTLQRKLKIYQKHPITFVAVSNWLAGKCRESTLLRDQDVRVIPNAFPVKTFATEPRQTVQTFDIDYSKNIILIGAARLDDPIKGLDYAIEALNIIADNNPQIADTSLAVLFGAVRNPETLKRLRFPHRHLGRVNNAEMIANLYASAKVVISTSLCETLPGTLIEGQAAGCTPVSFGNGGQEDIIDHKKTGYIARFKDAADVAKGILWALGNPIDRDSLHREVERKFGSDSVAKAYIDLFNELCKKGLQ